jgi:serine/threonine protein phosphatase 1
VASSRPRLAFHEWPAAIYAIGDVHGQLQQLRELEAVIVQDARDLDGEKWLVTLGDHIDRGPQSAQVVAHVLGDAPARFRRFALVGNHEALLVDFLHDPHEFEYWLPEGGAETLKSYGIGSGNRSASPATRDAYVERMSLGIPGSHLDYFMKGPISLSLPGWAFVHAGIRPGVPLALQDDRDLMWIREPFLSSQLTGGLRVVHGHTPVRDITMTPHRINLDTGCFASGKLSAVRITPDGRTKFFSVSGPPASAWSKPGRNYNL